MHSILQTTYLMQKDGPPPLTWEQYRDTLSEKWMELLNNYESKEERDYQNFLEQHPCLVPGSSGMLDTSGHAPVLSALFSQPRLPDFTCKIPDFMWIAKDSQSIYPILIEIEAPSKRWFNKDGTPSSALNQARDQLTQWKTWFSKPLNQLAFEKHYNLNLEFRHLKPHYVLIYGRREEANKNKEFAEKRQHLQDHDVTTMTFDRLAPNWNAQEFITVKAKRDGFDALYVPPTLTLGPMNADNLADVRNLDQAVNRSLSIPEDRREFLRSRIGYWQDWAKNKNIGVRRPSDWE